MTIKIINCLIKKYREKNKTEGSQSQLNSELYKVKRDNQKLYELKNISEGKKELLCHADLNGAMNIARKVIPEFKMEKLESYKRKEIFAYRLVKLNNYAVGKGMLTEIR